MAQVKITLNGMTFTLDAKAVPAFIASMSGKSAPTKSYIGENELNAIKATTPEEFVLKALDLQDGIHSVYSGMNKIIRARYGKDPVLTTTAMAEQGKITVNGTKGGVRIRKPVKAEVKK